MSSFRLQDNIFHGPSNRSKRKELYKQLFGTDSECEEGEHTEATQKEHRSGSESERDDDVLDITVENVFVTPTKESSLPNTPTNEYITLSKVKEHIQVPSLLSPLAETPQPKTPLFPNSPYTIRTKTTTHSNARFSPLHVIVHNDTRYHEHLQHQLRLKERGNTPLKCIYFEPYIAAIGKQNQHQQKQQNPSEQKLQSTEHDPKSNCKAAHSSATQLQAHSTQFQEPQHRSVASTHYQHTSKQTQQQKQAITHARAHTSTRTHSQIHAQVSSRKQKEQVRRNSSNRYIPYKKNTPQVSSASSVAALSVHRSISNNKQQQSNEHPTVNVCADDLLDETLPSFLKENRVIRSTSASGTIVERHNFEKDIRIEVNNNNSIQQRPITQVERQIVDSLEVVKSTSDGVRIIDLHNKNVPKGVHMAITVDSNKKYSKNALKKITRDLAKQFN